MIETKGVSKFFPVIKEDGTAEGFTALNSISLSIAEGKFVSLLGPSGCGKSTFLEILAGLQAPSDGEVWIDNKLVLEPLPSTRKEAEICRKKYRLLSPIANSLFHDNPKHDIAMIFQDYAVFPWMTARQNILFALKMRKMPKRERDAAATYYLRKVGLLDSGHKYPSQLSGGMRQRLALARALSVEPRIILMDEPFAAVDALTRERLQEDLLRLWEETSKTIVLVTHDVDEAACLSDEVVVFSPLPGSIRNTIKIDLPRPRRRNSPELRWIKERLMAIHEFDTVHEADYSI